MFLDGFVKTAKYDERAEYEQANKVDGHLSKLPHPSKLKVGERVAYHTEHRGWKEGPWGHHTKFCDADEEMDKKRKKAEAKLKKKGLEGHELFKTLDKEFPRHHNYWGVTWTKKAVGIGDMGTVAKVEKTNTGRESYRICWDKHPDCSWPGYDNKDLKTAPQGM